MNQERLARQMNEVVYAQRKLAYLNEKLEEILAYDPVPLKPEQRTLSVENLKSASHYQALVSETKWEIKQKKKALDRLMDIFLNEIPDIIKNHIRQGLPLVAQWQKEGIEPLALVFEDEKFTIVREETLMLAAN